MLHEPGEAASYSPQLGWGRSQEREQIKLGCSEGLSRSQGGCRVPAKRGNQPRPPIGCFASAAQSPGLVPAVPLLRGEDQHWSRGFIEAALGVPAAVLPWEVFASCVEPVLPPCPSAPPVLTQYRVYRELQKGLCSPQHLWELDHALPCLSPPPASDTDFSTEGLPSFLPSPVLLWPGSPMSSNPAG